ncbi:MAG: Tim44/TimA family putative adaptor protein [Azospirillaceae bacterium]
MGIEYLDILIFAVIAGFLIFRLRGVLGRRTGNERPRANPYNRPSEAETVAADNVVTLPGRQRDAGQQSGITQIRIADPDFEPAEFLGGARMAFSMIIEAFAKGDTATLRPLLSDELYDSFADAIRERTARGETLETTVVRIDEAKIAEARMDHSTAVVTVRFVSEQISVTRDGDGAVIDGDPERAIPVTDLWSFARNTRSSDPNWMLVETATPEEDEDWHGDEEGGEAGPAQAGT